MSVFVIMATMNIPTRATVAEHAQKAASVVSFLAEGGGRGNPYDKLVIINPLTRKPVEEGPASLLTSVTEILDKCGRIWLCTEQGELAYLVEETDIL